MRYAFRLLVQSYAFIIALWCLGVALLELLTTGQITVGDGETRAMDPGNVGLLITWLMAVAYTAWERDE